MLFSVGCASNLAGLPRFFPASAKTDLKRQKCLQIFNYLSTLFLQWNLSADFALFNRKGHFFEKRFDF